MKKFHLKTTLSKFLIPTALFFLIFLKNQKLNGIITLIGQTGLDIIITIAAYLIAKKSTDKYKFFFYFNSIAFIVAALADSSYNLILNILSVTTWPIYTESIFELPFLIFLTIQITLWMKILFKATESNPKSIAVFLLPTVAYTIAVTYLFFHLSTWKIDHSSAAGIYQIADTILEAATFSITSLCLAMTRKKSISLITTGIMLIIISDYLIRISVVDQSIATGSIFEYLWMIGQIISLMGFAYHKNHKAEYSDDNWFYEPNSIQPQISLFGFITASCVVGIILAIYGAQAISESYKNNLFSYVPQITMCTTVVLCLFSAIFSQRLLNPLTQIKESIKSLSNMDNKKITIPGKPVNGGILEYCEINKFIGDYSKLLHQKIEAEKKLSSISAMLAHDIHSPLSSIEMMLSIIRKDENYVEINLIRNSLATIRKMTATLLERFRSHHGNQQYQNHNSKTDLDTRLSDVNITDFILTKKNEWRDVNLEIEYFNYHHHNLSDLSFLTDDLLRSLSNLINNACEAITKINLVKVRIKIGIKYSLFLISDHGCGISKEKIPLVLNGKSYKHQGAGFGLKNAKIFTEQHRGKIKVSSKMGKGTMVCMKFPNPFS